jgi:hypothetical protein
MSHEITIYRDHVQANSVGDSEPPMSIIEVLTSKNMAAEATVLNQSRGGNLATTHVAKTRHHERLFLLGQAIDLAKVATTYVRGASHELVCVEG